MTDALQMDDARRMDDARHLVSSASRLLILTGAGVSAESGVPTFRGPDGLWKKRRQEEPGSLTNERKKRNAPDEIPGKTEWSQKKNKRENEEHTM